MAEFPDIYNCTRREPVQFVVAHCTFCLVGRGTAVELLDWMMYQISPW